MKIAIVGIRGLPNNYGGFETLADYLVEYLSADFEITVYCSSKDMDTRGKEYKGAKLKYIPVTSHGGLGIVYDSISLLNAIKNNDKILFLGFGGGFVMPFIKKYHKKIIVNIGGLDWQRNKWSPKAQKVIKKAESLLLTNCTSIISDNKGIQEYIKDTYHRDSELIAYGGDQATNEPITDEALNNYPFLKAKYAFIVTRIQQDNNIDMMLEAFSKQDKMPLVMVGNWKNSTYGIETKKKYSEKKKLILLDAIYDRKKLDVLRSNCALYIHGHSAGGTNPSLAEAMYLGLPVFAFASGYNEHTTEHKAVYFKNENELLSLIDNIDQLDLKKISENLKEVAERAYRWKIVADSYKKIFYS